MSTTFGIRIPETGEVVEVAFRTDYIRWENPLAHLLPNETKVEPLDNTAQGIYTIGDIKQKITRNYDESKPNIIVDQQRELLDALADNFNESTHTYVGQPMIEETLKAFNCA